ncbi:hypothetical protein [Streptomyces spectabilis]|uniref:Uncharacterized protein n=1 Tax=Streptomyces spectabilis TaxID=68270 RepID=A0A7W8B1X9_STRST|nr:hypothetical protein [Streptomyces spectabilis]MBB5108855.1 hypothetical protein [Streptomyces spectabilis]MCI3899846.1 hypothetical protein [Streptomyces spectabilis]GGV42524.1 hypothetical protein GCM10010245_66700 [Streptomyces spectabilis]
MHCTLLHALEAGVDEADDVDVDKTVTDLRERAGELSPFTLTFDQPLIGRMTVEISG